MKVAIDISQLKNHQDRGIGVYTKQLIKALTKLDKKNRYIPAVSKRELENADLIHYPNFDLFFLTLPLIKRVKTVVTVHDVIPLVFPHKFKPGFRGKIKLKLQKKALKRSDAVITDSENSKTDIIKYLHIAESQIHVIYLAAQKEFRPIKSINKYNFPFILYVGDVNYNKNVTSLISAFSQLENKQLKLFLISKAWKQNIVEVKIIRSLIEKLKLQNRIKQVSNISIKKLISLYNQAECYVQPSFYEGFGLPVLEAMACGTPVVSSNAASLPEVSSNAAIMVKPTVEGIASGIKKALSLNKNQKQALIEKGLKQTAKFSWTITAQKTIAVYNAVLGIRKEKEYVA